jgi:Restriction endonuclease
MKRLTGVSDAALQSRVLGHYHRVVPLIERSLSGTPIVYANYPSGIHKPPAFHVTAIPFLKTNVLLCIHARQAIEFYTWAPLPDSDDRLQFARILLETRGEVTFDRVKLAALAMRAILFGAARLEAIPMLDGGTGIALWIPLADAPHATPLRAWLHALCAEAVAKHPNLVSTEYNTHHDGRVHLHVASNAPGHYSAVPYGLRAQGLTVATPIHWEELGAFESAAAFTADTIGDRLEQHGDVFAIERDAIGDQRSPLPTLLVPPQAPRGHIITAAIEILEDGKPRTADELLAEALKRKLVPPNTLHKYVYSALIEYIARQIGRGRRPPIVQDALRRFCINEPPDDWPDLVAIPEPAADPAAQTLCDRLDATGRGDDPAAFEIAVCDAFAHLGFVTQHLGDEAQPDGIADAILGPRGYRVTVECKTAKGVVNRPDVAEAAKFREPFDAQLSVLVGPEFPEETELLQELHTHVVTAMTIADLQTLLHIDATALEVETILQPGYAGDVISDLLWQRRHGPAKRIATLAYLVQREGWNAQTTAAKQGGPGNAPNVTVDAAMLIVDEALRAAGSTEACTRDDVSLAFELLTNPAIGSAAWSDASKSSLIVLRNWRDA